MAFTGGENEHSWETIAYIGAGDEITSELIHRCLDQHGIKIEIYGSVYHCVSVQSENSAEAVEILQSNPDLKSRWIHFGDLEQK